MKIKFDKTHTTNTIDTPDLREFQPNLMMESTEKCKALNDLHNDTKLAKTKFGYESYDHSKWERMDDVLSNINFKLKFNPDSD